MVGLNKWCQLDDQAVPKGICNALQKGDVRQEDVDRLKDINMPNRASGKDGNLSKQEKYRHKLWDLKVHHSKSKDGCMKLYWPEGTPNAQVLTGTRGGNGKGKTKRAPELQSVKTEAKVKGEPPAKNTRRS